MKSSSSSTSVRRLGALVGPVLVGAFVLASCGGSDAGPTKEAVDLSADSTAFVVRPPVTTEPPADSVAAGDPNATVDGTQDYTVVSGDAWYVLTKRFAVSLDDLLAVNEWTDSGKFPNPGDVILLPPGAKSVAAVAAASAAPAAPAATGDSTAASGEGDTTAATPEATIPDAGDNCAAGKYTILDGDFEGKVASKFDVTLDALRVANSGTANYKSFYPGLVIVIPSKAAC